ncbi:MAG: UvrD-helicase domain-containing protein [Thermodesulfobacteriota bacterium]
MPLPPNVKKDLAAIRRMPISRQDTMNFLADLHIHSPFSRATSKDSTLAGLATWARVKGIHLIGTGDFTHPGWFAQIREELVAAEPGLFKLRDEKSAPALPGVTPEAIPVRFLLSAEISSIYKRHGQVRKVHNILFAPDLASAERINRRLAAIGNIESDGRPILGLDSRDLLEIQLEEMADGFLVPAHIWTPWFSLFGSKSGFDSIEECFGDLSSHIFALETGLSSDPDMNRLISGLDRYTLISNSDCHSPAKLGREVNRFACDFDFFSMKKALQEPTNGFLGTVEFFPEEGKYHLDGHRACNVVMEPAETKACRGVCPVCGKPLTVGVSHRVMDLADRKTPLYPANGPTFTSLIPLPEVIGEIMAKGPTSKGVMEQYARTINRFGSEFNLFLHTTLDEITLFSPILGEAIARIRANRVIRRAGFDGQFGVIRAFAEGEIDRLCGQAALFGESGPRRKKEKKIEPGPQPPLFVPAAARPAPEQADNPAQRQAITSPARRILVAAGPGTGKTHTLVGRLLHLITARGEDPAGLVAITFTNRAANEVRERLRRQAGAAADEVFVGTFHRFCLDWLQREKPGLAVIGDDDRELVLRRLYPQATASERKKIAGAITVLDPTEKHPGPLALYLHELERLNAIDLEMIIPVFVARLRSDASLSGLLQKRVRHLFVDEFQDVNQAQYDLVTLLGRFAALFVIGDANQAIYGFRGSDLRFFLRFAEESGTECLALESNYRSAPEIIQAAGALIRHNRLRGDNTITAQRATSGEIFLLAAPTARAEAEQVVKQIEKLLGGISSFSINSGRSGGEQSSFTFRDIGILYRLARQAEPLAEALERRGIPFQLVGARPFFMEHDILPLALLTLAAADLASAADWLTLCRELPGIGTATLNLLEKEMVPGNGAFLRRIQSLLPRKAAELMASLEHAIHHFQAAAATALPEAFQSLFPLFQRDPASANARRFLRLAGAFGDPLALARHLAENRQATIYDDRAEAVSLLTLHGAKGLEFPVVFITGMNDGLLPCRLAGCEPEEERRLFYVGMTRAKDRLLLCHSAAEAPSPFLAEIPAELLHSVRDQGPKRNKNKSKQLTLF